MATPPRMRYWLIRLRDLNHPWFWCSVLGLALFGIAFREYRQHPEWLGRFNDDVQEPGSLSGTNSLLTPDEQAALADIGNSATLLAELGLQPLPFDQDVIEEEFNNTLLSALQELGTSNSASQLQRSTNDQTGSPFEPYLQQYRFAQAEGSATLLPPPPEGLNSVLETPLPPNQMLSASQGAAPAAQTSSPLEQALQRQVEQQAAQEEAAEANPSLDSAPNLPGQTPPWLIQRTLPGTNRRFILTTPEMSPVPGTTGYTPPSTLNLAPSAVTPTFGASPLPSAAAGSPNLAPAAIQSGAAINGGAASSGSVVAPVGGSTYAQPVQQSAPSFTVPRPNSYTGGGYINTFSDPAGFVDGP